MPRNSKQPLDAALDLKQNSEIAETVTLKQPEIRGESPVNKEVYGGGSISTNKLTANATDEYVSAGGYVWLARYVKALPFYIDSKSRDFGSDIYDRMMEDPQIAAAVNLRKSAVLSKGIKIVPIKDQTEKSGPVGSEIEGVSDLSKQIADFCQSNLDNLQGRSFLAVAFEMLDAIAFGHKIAEMVFDDQNEPGKLRLKALKVKPRTSAAFAVDPFFNIVGILGLIPGTGAPVIIESIIGDPSRIPNMLPRKKFAILSHRMFNGDPRGTSDLSCVYEPWFLKRVNWGEWAKYMTIFGGGILVGKTAPDAVTTEQIDANGNPTGINLTPEQILLAALQQLHAGGAAAFPSGTEIDQLLPNNTGSPYAEIIEMCDKQITKGLLYQTLATEEGAHMSRAAAGTHQDVLGVLIRLDKLEFAAMVRNDILHTLVELNWGTDIANRLTPNVVLGETEDQDFPNVAQAVAALQNSGYLHWSQLQGVDAMLSLPERDINAQRDELAEQAKQEAIKAQPQPKGAPAGGS